jgi:hypothetical protein
MPPETAVATVEPTRLPSVRKPPREALAQLEQVVIQGNLANLSENERIGYYARVCESLGLNPLTRPFEYITLNGKLTLYARKDATDQLRDLHGVTIDRLERERSDDLQIVTAYAKDRYGRTDSSIGAVSIKGLSGEALANALMKAETKAKRRVTLSIVGLGWMDEVEALDQRAYEVAPRQSLTSAIASRTAALTGGSTDPGESDAGGLAGAPAGGAEATGSPAPVAGSPDCAHDPKSHETRDSGVVCGDCGTVLAERPAETAQPRSRAKAAAKPRQRRAKGEEGHHRARAHAIADKRGLDPDALKRIAGEVLGKEGDWSRTSMTEDEWEYVAGVVETAPERLEDDKAWMDAATQFAGEAAITAGFATKLETDADWAPVEAKAEELMGTPADKLDANEWVELAIRWSARAA